MACIWMAVLMSALAVTGTMAQQAPAPAPTTKTSSPPPPLPSAAPPSIAGALTCVAELVPCGEFYNNETVTPSQACCVPLTKAYKTELACLCAVFTNPALGKQLGIDLKKGISLFGRCGIDVPANVCSAASPASTPEANAPVTPPKVGNAAVHGAKWIGYSGFLGFLLALWSLLA